MSSFTDTVIHRYLRRPYTLHVAGDVGEGPVIIFLHGIAASSASWQHVVPLLSPHYRCITIDVLGFGASPKPVWGKYTVDDHIQSIHQTIKSLRISGPFILAGHSLGSLLAARYARLHPQRVRRLLMLSPPVYLHPKQVTAKLAKRMTSAYLRLYRYVRLHKKFTLKTSMRIQRLLPAPDVLLVDEANWHAFVSTLEHCIELQTVIDDVARVEVPVDVFYGSLDQFLVPNNVRILGKMRHVTLHKLQADHQVGKRYAQVVAAVIIDQPDTSS